jgi:hypothetical protein
MPLRSRADRERQQRHRMARGRRNLSQLAGPQAQGQRTPMNRGSGSVSTVQAPPFQESNVGADIMQAGLAYKGASGINDFATGTDAYIDKAGNYIKAREPWTIGGESISDKIGSYGTEVSDRFSGAKEGLTGLFGSEPTPESMGYQNPSFGLNSTNQANPTVNAPSRGLLPGGRGPEDGMSFTNQPASTGAGLGTGMSTFNAPPQLAKMSSLGSLSGAGAGAGAGASSAGSSLLSGSAGITGGIPAGVGEGFGLGSQGFGSSLDASGAATGSIQAGSSSGSAVSGMQGADAATTGASGQPWMAYANIAKDLFVGGPGSEKITGSTAGDAVLRAGAAYFTFGLSEIPYALF